MTSTTKPAPDAAAWEEAFERDLAKFLRDRLAADPPPMGSPIGHDAARWAENLELRAEANRVGIGPYSPTEEGVLTEARYALERYALRLPDDSPWRERLEWMAEGVHAGATIEWMRVIHHRGVRRPGQEDDVLAEAVQALNNWIERLPETSLWRETFREIGGEIAHSIAAHEALEREQQGD